MGVVWMCRRTFRYAGSTDPDATMLGAAQWAWLEQKLAEPADLRLVVTSIQFVAVGHPWERWAALPLEQSRFYQAVAAAQETGGGGGVVLLSGDRHVGGAYRQDPGPTPHSVNNTMGYPVWEFTSSSLTHTMSNRGAGDAFSLHFARFSPLFLVFYFFVSGGLA